MDFWSDVLAMDERTYRAWVEQAKGQTIAARPEAAARLIPARKSVGNVAIVPLSGFITAKPEQSLFSMLFGGTSALAFAREVVSSLNDPSIGAVVMDVDSPGGDAVGMTEAATAIRNARGQKPLVAVANSIATSAAYWLASQAHELVVTPSALVGSIGVFSAHVDQSKALESEGLKVTFISSARRKTEGNSAEPLSDEAAAGMQARVDYFHGLFVADVAKGRKVSASKVSSDYGEGAVLTADAAVKAGLADRIATLDEVVSSLAGGYRPARMPARAYDEAAGRFMARLAGLKPQA